MLTKSSSLTSRPNTLHEKNRGNFLRRYLRGRKEEEGVYKPILVILEEVSMGGRKKVCINLTSGGGFLWKKGCRIPPLGLVLST